MTRLLVAVLALGLGALALSTSLSAKVDPAKNPPKDTCVKPCQECATECINCMKHAREHKMNELAMQCEICHTMCLTCANAVASKNGRAWDICELCEKVCLDCATLCEKDTSEHAKKCAKSCRDCATACANARK
jgi:hypothetical protein